MTRLLTILLFLIIATNGIAQKTRVGVVNTDSLLKLIPEYADWSKTRNDNMIDLQRHSLEIQYRYMLKQMEIDSLMEQSGHNQQVGKDELLQIEREYTTFVEHATDSAHVSDSILTAPSIIKLARAEFMAAEKNRCNGIAEFSEIAGRQNPPGISYVNISKDVAKELQTPTTVSAKKRVGYCNYDSLLKLTPGYQAAFDSSNNFQLIFDKQLMKMQEDLSKKQKEFDSLRSQSSPLINSHREQQIQDLTENIAAFEEVAAEEKKIIDAAVFQKVYERLDMAIYIASRENNCVIAYDTFEVHKIWTEKEAEFIDLNKEIAGKLRQ